MNKFSKLVDKLLKVSLWSNQCVVIQLEQKKINGKIIYTDKRSKCVECVKKETTRIAENNIFKIVTSFYISSKNLESFDLSQQFAIVYNTKRYNVADVFLMGTLNNEDALVKMDIIR